jgi:hypothetical protein
MIKPLIRSTPHPYNRATGEERDNQNRHFQKNDLEIYLKVEYVWNSCGAVARARLLWKCIESRRLAERTARTRLASQMARSRTSRMPVGSSEINRVLERAAQGDGRVLGRLLVRHQLRLRRTVALRLDRPLQGQRP